MNHKSLAALAALTLAGLGGCAIDTQDHGRSSIDSPASRSGRDELDVDAQGNLLLHGHVLSLPQAREDRRWGAVFLDVSPLASSWRPLTATEGGIVVAAVRSDSPLAMAGLRPFDRIKTIDGEAVASVGSLVARLEAVPEGSKVRLDCETHVERNEDWSNATHHCVAVAGGELDAAHQLWLPLIFEERRKSDRSELTIGPLDSLFYTWTKHNVGGHESREYFEWGALFNLVVWRSEAFYHVDSSGEPEWFSPRSERELRLFYFVKL